MATLYIAEYDEYATTKDGVPILAGAEPNLATQTVTYTTSTQSSALNANTRYVRVIADADAYLLFGTNPTATASSLKIEADTPEYFAIKRIGSLKIAAYDGTS